MLKSNGFSLSKGLQVKRGMVFGLLIVAALFAFELFNYSTTDFALSDLLGDLRFIGIRWATILSIAFCGIDFAGIARLFTTEQGRDEPTEVWYLFGAWMLAAIMNAMLTWWGVSIAILNHDTLGNVVVARETLVTIVPIFVAIMVWLIRVLIIGTISIAGEHFFNQSAIQSPGLKGKTTKYKPPSSQGETGSRAIRPLNKTRSNPIRRGFSSSSYHPPSSNEHQYTNELEYKNSEPRYSPVSNNIFQERTKSQTKF